MKKTKIKLYYQNEETGNTTVRIINDGEQELDLGKKWFIYKREKQDS